METKLKPYMGYSRGGGSCEGAILIFAHDIKQARRYAWRGLNNLGITDEYTDMAVNLLRDSGFLFDDVPEWSKEKLRHNIPHVVDSPPSCKACLQWGYELNAGGLCESCAEEEQEG